MFVYIIWIVNYRVFVEWIFDWVEFLILKIWFFCFVILLKWNVIVEVLLREGRYLSGFS